MIDLVFTAIALLIAVITMAHTKTSSKVRHINLCVAAEFSAGVGFLLCVQNLPDGAWFDISNTVIHIFFAWLFYRYNGIIQSQISILAACVSSVSAAVGGLGSYFEIMILIQSAQLCVAGRGMHGSVIAWRYFNRNVILHTRNYHA